VRSASVAAALALAASSPVRSLGAQERASVLAGKVVADVTTRVLAGAEITVRGLPRVVHTDSSGLFAIDGIPAGTQVVLVRHPGYEPLSVSIDFTGADTLARMFVLDRITMPVTASASVDSVDATSDKYRDFRRRRARGLGLYMVHDDFADSYDRPLSEVLRRLPGITLVRNARNPMVAVASSRGYASLQSQSQGDGFLPACYVQVYVDGVRVFAAGHGQNPVDINSWRTDDIEAIEYYASPDRTPPEFAGSGAICGTLSLWLRI
jgi:hypothetical protein